MAKSLPRFKNAARRQDHYARHGRTVGATSPGNYERMAGLFLTRPRAAKLHQKKRSNGDLIRYNEVTEEFGVLSAAGVVKTFFIPDPTDHGYPTNLDYYHAQ
jgi:pyocin large subunit-like protein